MHRRQFLALGGAILALVLACTGVALAAGGTKVTVRVEGKTRTLLAPTVVTTHTGFITKGGAPSGACARTSAAGALDAATGGNWTGKFYASFSDYLISSILGETESGKKFFWGFYDNNKFASLGLCQTKVHPGDQLLLAAVPASGNEYPIAINAPASAKVGHQFNVTVVWFNAKGKPKPLKGATLSAGAKSGKTDSHGIVPLTPTHAGTFLLQATHTGYIRAAAVRLRVTG
jgi:hypothetical protein